MSQTKRLSQLFAAESWLNNYRYLVNADFKAYDFQSLREALLNYVQINYPEDFNDFINSSEYVALIDLISFLGQNLAFRADLNLRETFLETAEVRENILNNARQLGYKPFRNRAATGFLRVQSIQTTQNLYDSRGQNLSGQAIIWGDATNLDFNEQFTLILNEAFNKNNPFGRPVASVNSAGATRQIYELAQPDNRTMVETFTTTAKNNQSYTCEIVPLTINSDTALIEEKTPNPYGAMTVLFNNDGTGFSNRNNGWFFMFKQGSLKFNDYVFNRRIENRVVDIGAANVNETDVWVQNINGNGQILISWTPVPSVVNNNIIFNNIDKNNRYLYEVITQGNDAISIKFGDGNFANIPTDNVRIWYRQSANENITITPIDIDGLNLNIRYVDSAGIEQTLTLVFALTQDAVGLTNESIDQIKNRAARTAATQDRMITANDYNTYPEGRVPGVEKISAINRTHAGQSVYSDLQDPTGTYRPVITLADDAFIFSTVELGEDSIADTTGTNRIFRWLENSLLKRPLHQFYYRNFPVISALPNLHWKLVDTTVGSSHGFFTIGNNGTVPVRVGRGTTETALRTVRKNTLIKTAGNTWHRIIDVYREGFGVNNTDGTYSGLRANGEGAVFITGIRQTVGVSEWLPALRTNFTVGEKNEIQQLIRNQFDFGLRYDHQLDLWKVVTADILDVTADFELNTTGKNWLIRLQHNDLTDTWTCVYRKDLVTFGSKSQLVFHNQRFGVALDTVTRRQIKDSVEFLTTNEGVDSKIVLDVAGYFVLDDGRYDPKRVQLWLPGLSNNLVPENPELIDLLLPGSQTVDLKRVEYSDAAGQFTVQPVDDDDTVTVPILEAVPGRQNLKVQYNHAPLRDNRVNATTTNLIDLFVLTSDYNTRFRNWLLTNLVGAQPLPMTSAGLEAMMSPILPYKSISDTVVFHPVKYKVIFGTGANLSDQCTIRVTKSDGTKTSNAEIRSQVVVAINDYFSASNWDFGESFYFTDMAAWIHRRLAGVITSIVLVPKQPTVNPNRFYQIKCESDELLISSATVNDVDVITTQQTPLPQV